MEYLTTAFFNETRGSRFERYIEGAELVQTSLEPFYVNADSPEGAAERVFRLLNDDLRPNGKTERSLSVGDVVCVRPSLRAHDGINGFSEGDRIRMWFAVEGCGFRQIDAPAHASVV